MSLLASAACAADPAEWARSGRPPPPRESVQATLDAQLPGYAPSGALAVLEGSAPPILAQLVNSWLRDFHEREPGVRVTVPPPYLPPQGKLNPRLRAFLHGYLDFAFLTREMAASDVEAFRAAHGFEPLQIAVSGGSWRHFGFVDAVAVIVNESNPVRGLSLAQLDAIFSRSRHRGHASVASWDQVGVKEWAGRPVHVVGTGAWADEESARAMFFRERVMDGRRRGEWRETGSAPDSGDDAVTGAVAADPLAIGFTAMGHLVPGTRALAISVGPGQPFIEPDLDNVARASYPLSRVFYLAVARKPGHALPPALDAFARFLLSAPAQHIVLGQGVFLPLRAWQAQASLRLLEP